MQKICSTLVIIFLLLASHPSFGKIRKYDVIIQNNIPYCNVMIQDLMDDSVVVIGHGIKYKININDISSIGRERKSRGAAGIILGGVFGLFMYSCPNHYEPDFGRTILFAGIGGLTGLFISADEYYDFTNMVYWDKVELIKWLITDRNKRLY